MKKIIYAILTFSTACALITSCNHNDYLSVSSPAKADDDFVTTSVSETFKTLAYCYATYRGVAAGGNYNWNDPCTDVEYYPEYNSGNGRLGFLQAETATVNQSSGNFNNLYSILSRCARVAAIIEQKPEFIEAKNAGQVNDWTQLYGEAHTFWAYAYFELVRHFGDVPFGIENQRVTGYTLTSRYDIMDACIAKLKEVESLMYDLGEGGINAERMSRTFANMLIGEIALTSGGYQTLRSDVEGLYGSVSFEKMHDNAAVKCFYARRSDWKDYYKEAQTYFRKALNERKGSMQFITVDERNTSNNPFQRGLQYAHDKQISPDSIFEVGNKVPMQSERPYSQGRPSDGGNSNGAPCKVFSGIRVMPTFYYTGYEDGDTRWDASAVVTGSDGKGNEKLVTLVSGSRNNGGIAINKWDDNKMAAPNLANVRKSGMNYVMRRTSNVMLMLAEASAFLGDDAEAIDILNQIRDRAFGDNAHRLSGLTGTALTEAVTMEFKREFLGEGYVKYNEVRSGTFPALALKVREDIKTVIAGLEKDGYYTFANGRTIPAYVWTKLVKRDNPLTFDRVEGDPVLCPGWRGVMDYSATVAASAVVGDAHNLAIEGLFEYIDPAGADAAALEADGYVKTDWGIGMVSNKSTLWDTNVLVGIETSIVPRYYHPIPLETLQQSGGNVTNGYGLPQK